MLTILIMGGAIGIALMAVALICDKERLTMCGVIIMLFSMFLAGQSQADSIHALPDGFQEINSYYYIAENGDINEMKGAFYIKDSVYHTQNPGASRWVPFGECAYEPIDMPGTPANNKCPNCGLESVAYYCSTCGAKIN